MSYEWVDHTAELELHVEAASPELVFQDTMRAYAELVGPATGAPSSHAFELEAPDGASRARNRGSGGRGG